MARWRMPWHRSIGPVGLDLGTASPCAMQVRVGADEPVAAAAARVAGDATLVERAEAAVVALRSGPFVGREVVVGLGPGAAHMLVSRLPELDESDAAGAIAWEASEKTGIPHERVVADAVRSGSPAHGGDARDEYILAAADGDELAAALEVLVSAGLEPVAVEPRFASVARALGRRTRRDSDADNVRAVLHVDDERSTVLVLRGDRMAFCREISTGGAALDRAVAARLGIDERAAHALRARRMAAVRGDGPSVEAVTEDAAVAATRAALDSLAGEVALCLRYYSVTFRGAQPSRVVLSGPGAFEPRLAGTLETACRAGVVAFADELPSGFLAAAGRVEGVGGDLSDWIAAFGLACRGRRERAEERAA
jgi:type IV pilus assembly protein PilM